MFDVDLGYPLSLGVVAAFNPCGFAMLPAYVSYFMGLESSGDDKPAPSTARNIGRGLVVGFTLTAGFLTVFGVIGVLTNTFLSSGAVQSNIGYPTTFFGVVMVFLGIAMWRGFEPKINVPRLSKGGQTSDLWSIYLFGISYAVVSLSCTIGLFLGVVASSFTREGFVDGVGTFVAYAAGMGAVMMVLTVGVALAQNSVAKKMKQLLPYINRTSGVLLFLAGIFLTIWGIEEIRISRDPLASASPIVETAEELQSTVQQWANDSGPTRLAMGALVLIVAAVVFGVAGQLKTRRDKAMLVAPFAAIYAFIEIVRYEWDLLVLPLIRTIGDIPERIGNWFTDPFRWPVLFELLLAALIAAIIYVGTRSSLSHSTSDENASKPLEPV